MDNIRSLLLYNSKITANQEAIDGCLNFDGKTVQGAEGIRRIVVESRPDKGSFIITEIWLPKNWNGIFVGLGNGGMAGKINHWNLLKHAHLGYATANTDLGTSRGIESGINNPDVWRDFGWRATHIMTTISKQIIKDYYGKAPQYSYFHGQSTGGQQALSEAQRFPNDYDGIIAGVPAISRIALHTYFLWNYTHLVDPEFGPLFTNKQFVDITAYGVEFFQNKGDGKKGDNFITNPYHDETSVSEFIEHLRSKYRFSHNQLKALTAVYEGPKDPKTGKQIHCGVPIGSEKFATNLLGVNIEEMPHVYPFKWVNGMDFYKFQFDFSDDFLTIRKALSNDMDALNSDLTEFYKSGGKLISYSGTADSVVPYAAFVKYYNRVCRHFGSVQEVQSFFKWFLLPGKNHNMGGDGVNAWFGNQEEQSLLETLRKWREEGIEPMSIIGARKETINGEAKIVYKRECPQYNGDWVEGKDFPYDLDESYI